MNVGSFFTGAGGLDLGFELEGFEVKWCIEWDPYAQAILRKKFPNAHIYGNVAEVNFTKVQSVDIFIGGPPCQDISNAGKRVGITGSRSKYWKNYAEAIRILRPKIAIIENVSALTIRGLDVILADLAKIGYDAEWYNISASSVGAFHRRERIFIIAYPNSSGQLDRQIKQHSTKRRKSPLSLSEQSSSNASHPNNNQYGEQCEKSISEKINDVSNTEYRNVSKSKLSDREIREESQKASNRFSYENSNGIGWWLSEPDVVRVADGVPFRVDRIKCLGNAVVPQVAQVIAQTIKEVEKNK